jgi:hypothetical protein
LAETLQWSDELERSVADLLEDRSWDVRAAARGALGWLWRSREVFRVKEEAVAEEDLARRWTLVDAAFTLGYPGVVPGSGLPSWLGPMIVQQPYALRQHALTQLKEKRKKVTDKLEKRERK